jgi:hypothetical protein
MIKWNISAWLASKFKRELGFTEIEIRDQHIMARERIIGRLTKENRELKEINMTLGQAVALCDSTDPDNPVMDGNLYREAMKALETD